MALFHWHDAITHWSLIVEAPSLDIARIRAVAIIRTTDAANRQERACLLLAIHANPPEIQQVHP